MLQVSKENGCEKIKWIKSVRKHLLCHIHQSRIWGSNCCQVDLIPETCEQQTQQPPRPSLPEMCSWRNVIKIMDKEWSVDSLMINKNHNDHNDHKHFPSPYSSSFLFESICINSKSYQSLIYFCRNKIKSHLVKHKDYK